MFTQEQNKQRVRKLQQMRDLREIKEKQEILFQDKIIRNTKDTFNPIAAYFKIYAVQILFSITTFYLLYLLFQAFMAIQIYEDPFTKKKTLMLVSTEQEKKRIRQGYVNFSFCGEKISSSSSELNGKLIKGKIQSLTTRSYDVQIVKSIDHLVIWMPEKVLISSNLLVNGEFTQENLTNMLLLMEGLFARRIHIKNISISSQQYFLTKNVNPHSESAIIKIYTYLYSPQQIWDTIDQIGLKYAIPASKITESLEVLSRITKHDKAKTSLKNRLNLKATLAYSRPP